MLRQWYVKTTSYNKSRIAMTQLCNVGDSARGFAKALLKGTLCCVAMQNRRAAISFVAGAAALIASPNASKADFGDSANVFGKVTNKTGERADFLLA